MTAAVTHPADPQRPITVFEQRCDEHLIELVEPRQAPVAPARKTGKRANPERAIACGQEAVDVPGWQLLTVWGLPGDEARTVEAKQPELAPQPEVSIGGLGHSEHGPEREPLAH